VEDALDLESDGVGASSVERILGAVEGRWREPAFRSGATESVSARTVRPAWRL